MRAGRLNKRISVISPRTTARSTDGAPIVTHTTVLGDIWASVEPMGGREQFRGDYRWVDSDTRFTIRYSTVSITPSNLIVYNGSTYDIQGIVNTDERNRELVIMARIAT